MGRFEVWQIHTNPSPAIVADFKASDYLNHTPYEAMHEVVTMTPSLVPDAPFEIHSFATFDR